MYLLHFYMQCNSYEITWLKVVMSYIEIEPELFLVLFRPGTTSVRSGLGTFFVPEPEHTKHSLCS